MNLSRRTFLWQLSALYTKLALSLTGIDRPPISSRTSSEIGSQELRRNQFHLLPLTSIRPAGWLLDQLKIQASGLTGHLPEVWQDVGPESGWLGGDGENWERGPYYLDGLVPLAYLLDDSDLKKKAQKWIDWTLASQRPNGMFGPTKNDDWWPRMVMLKVLTQYAEATGDNRVVPFLERYFAYQLGQLPSRPLRDWGKYRWHDQVVSVFWLFEQNGDRNLLKLARILQSQGHNWRREFENFPYTGKTSLPQLGLAGPNAHNGDVAMSAHGVNNAMGLKACPVSWRLSGRTADRKGIEKQLEILDRYHGLPNGMFSGDEHLAGRNPSQGIELCAVVEAMYSLEQAIAILGDAALGDRLERIAFNALPAAFTDDMWAHQYDQQPNQVECSHRDRQWVSNGPDSNLFGLAPNFGCCTANMHQGWPKLTSSLWMSSSAGLTAVAYAPCSVTTQVSGTRVRIIETTDYPFREAVTLQVSLEAPTRFSLNFRIPRWTSRASIAINGNLTKEPSPGTFATINRQWHEGDRVEIRFPMHPRVTRGYRNAVVLERGPIIFSLNLDPKWARVTDRGPASDWSATAGRPWNYALAFDHHDDNADIICSEHSSDGSRFRANAPPVELHVVGRAVPEWKQEGGSAGVLPTSPVLSNESDTSLTLIPYAAAKLRITAFPQLEKS